MDLRTRVEQVRKSAETGALSSTHRPLGTHGLWGDKAAQLPAYIQNIAHGLIRNGHSESEAIQLAVGAVKRWAAGGGHVTPEVQAAAGKAVAEWEALKAAHSKGFHPDQLRGPGGKWIHAGAIAGALSSGHRKPADLSDSELHAVDAHLAGLHSAAAAPMHRQVLSEITNRNLSGLAHTIRGSVQEPDSGFTIHPQTGSVPEHGYQVGIDGHTMKVGGKVPTVEDINGMSDHELAGHLDKWMLENQDAFDDPNMHIGGWHEPGTDKVHLDLSENVPNREQAIQLGQQRNQLAVWDNEGSDVISTGGTGDVDG